MKCPLGADKENFDASKHNIKLGLRLRIKKILSNVKENKWRIEMNEKCEQKL